MKAFKIDKKSYLYKVMKACEWIAKSRRFANPSYGQIHYISETNEIVATNGYVLLIYQTDEIKQNLGELPNGSLVLSGEFLIFDEQHLECPDYKRIVDSIKAEKTLRVDWIHKIEADHELMVELAFNGVFMDGKWLKPIKDIYDLFDRLILQKNAKHSPFCLEGENIRFIANPLIAETWKEC